MQKWEYLREAVGAGDLTARGLEGWELVTAIVSGSGSGILVFKRPLVEEPEEPAVSEEPVVTESEPEPEEPEMGTVSSVSEPVPEEAPLPYQPPYLTPEPTPVPVAPMPLAPTP